MRGIYEKPLRVYLILGALALWGIYSGMSLSVSLFPISNQVTVSVYMAYGSYSSSQFVDSVGSGLESSLQSVRVGSSGVDKVTSEYEDKNAYYKVEFPWGTNPDEAVKAVETKVISQTAHLEQIIRNSVSVNVWRQNQGFFAVSFYSPLRSLDELYRIMDPILKPVTAKIADAERVGLYNPNSKEITVRLLPDKLAVYGLSTAQVDQSVRRAVLGLNGGSIRVGDKDYQLQLPKDASSIDVLGKIRVSAASQSPIFLKDVAKISLVVTEESMQRFKTSGVESLILFANPKEGGNIKRMSDDIMKNMLALQPQWPADVQFKVLVNPSDFINKSISGVVKEVFIAALLAVFVLFLFIGSFRNVVTAAIEIPLSLLLAFILMKITGMNLNLISLGGLALSAGMNVDASVVVLENIFRHFEGKPQNMSFEEKTATVVEAVKEVRMPIIASTIASLVVFMPLIFTQGLTNSLLGDLAKAIIFSHGLSAVVALFLVPTIRLHLLRRGEMGHVQSPIEGTLSRVENLYTVTLTKFLSTKPIHWGVMAAIVVILPAMALTIIPRLKKEIIGKPESDWLVTGVNSPLVTTAKQLESDIEEYEQQIMAKFGNEIQYTFTQINGTNYGSVMLRLKDRKSVERIQTALEETFKNTATKFYWVVPWNPSELRIPDPPQFRLEISGGTPESRLDVARNVNRLLKEDGIYEQAGVVPNSDIQKGILVEPVVNLYSQPSVLSREEISHYLRTATNGVFVENISSGTESFPIYLRMPKESTDSIEKVSSLPIGFEGRVLPMSALAKFSIRTIPPSIYRENQQSLVLVTAKLKKTELSQAKEKEKLALAVVEAERKAIAAKEGTDKPSLLMAQADIDLQNALAQLKTAILISAALIFLTMVLQLGDIVNSLLVLVAIPLGFIGVLLSLFVFGSTLSLNSGLGTILLNGIAVANSIILVDFIKKLHADGLGAHQATVRAATARLRPILMTSLTTVLGMFPIALGLGEGGKTLQPLGITVCGGLWVSMLLTLYIVPCLQYKYLLYKDRKVVRTELPEGAPAG